MPILEVAAALDYVEGMRRRTREIAFVFATLAASPLSGGCDAAADVSGVYVESFSDGVLPENRDWALRFTVYQFGETVGGWVEFYEVDGLNTPQEPYLRPTACAYFGPLRRTTDGLVISTAGVVEGEDLQLRFTTTSRRSMSGIFEAPGGIFAQGVDGVGHAVFAELDSEVAGSHCPEGVPLLADPSGGFP